MLALKMNLEGSEMRSAAIDSSYFITGIATRVNLKSGRNLYIDCTLRLFMMAFKHDTEESRIPDNSICSLSSLAAYPLETTVVPQWKT